MSKVRFDKYGNGPRVKNVAKLRKPAPPVRTMPGVIDPRSLTTNSYAPAGSRSHGGAPYDRMGEI